MVTTTSTEVINGRDVRATDDRLGCSLGDEELPAVPFGEHGDATAFVIEWGGGDPAEFTGRAVSRAGCFPEGDVEGVAADGGVASGGGLVADESEGEYVGAVVAGRRDGSFEADPSVGEGAGLVGEQHVDVAEVLDADQPLDEHLLRRRAAEIR